MFSYVDWFKLNATVTVSLFFKQNIIPTATNGY